MEPRLGDVWLAVSHQHSRCFWDFKFVLPFGKNAISGCLLILFEIKTGFNSVTKCEWGQWDLAVPSFDRALLTSPPNHCCRVGKEVETSGFPCTRFLVVLLVGEGICRGQPSRPHHPWPGQPVGLLGLTSASSNASSPLWGKTHSHYQPHFDIFCDFFFFFFGARRVTWKLRELQVYNPKVSP